MVIIKQKGSFRKTRKFLKKLDALDYYDILSKYASRGVDLLKRYTPVDTGLTASSWGYEVEIRRDGATINWTNSNINKGIPIALIIQYGHATKNGTFVQGVDYINPALKPVFDELAKEVWKEVSSD